MNTEKPMFLVIIEMIEDDILSGVYNAHDLIISTTQISKLLSVNPTTSNKAISIMTDQGILYKRRGIGMCVTEEAKESILKRRKAVFYNDTLPSLLAEATKLGISESELIQIIGRRENDKSE